MVKATPVGEPYSCLITDATHQLIADTTSDKGGNDNGFRPHELLEAALASCLTISLRMYLENQGIKIDSCSVTVELDRSNPDKTVFRKKVELNGAISESDRKRIEAVLASCPVQKTLSKELAFVLE
ncbi:putative redox protein [Hydrogenispora ethanolica]|uniref:Putative redox protein n=1 Tax=Hydrogenispora ethanolica TaxID=1082276 RepID=A0A4R1QSM3_HYDET|nr:OsmC family protein [Hydrogenispora ethanolica]TCL56031.1 putative redox protein [Hydrogenispora ethanolica]